MEKKECYGEMAQGKMECKSCPLQTKIACFTETMKEKHGVSGDCLTSEGRMACLSQKGFCKNPKLQGEDFMADACLFLGKLSAFRKDKCSSFGTLNLSFDKSKIKTCGECDEELYKKCEVVETNLRKFPHLAYENTIKDELEKEIRMTEEDGACLGGFEFNETDCFEECDFKVTCLRKTGIRERPPFDVNEMPNYPTICKYFPHFEEIKSLKNKEKFDELPPNLVMKELCVKCPFEQTCKEFITGVRDWLVAEDLKKIVFSNFYTLREVRKTLMVN